MESELQKSSASAEAMAHHCPQYAGQITSAARDAYLRGDKIEALRRYQSEADA